MSLTVDMSFDTREATRFLRLLGQKGVREATRRALNKAAAQTKTQASKSIRQKRNLKARVVNGQLKVLKANRRQLNAAVQATGRPIPLIEYGGKTKAIPGNHRRKFSAEVDKGKRKVVRGAFVATVGGISSAFERKGSKRLPIRTLYGPSLPSTFLKDEIVRAMRTKVRQVYPRLLSHEVEREISKAGRR